MTLHIAIVQTESKLLNIPIKVLCARVMIDTMQTTLQYCPDAFDAVGADSRAAILTIFVIDRIVIVGVF
jgi:hypothetical protein